MSNQVYANNMEVSCKKAAGKSICAFPDVCFTPPQTPPTPTGVPIPYPNTGMASDTSDGSSTVKISGQEVMLKNKSSFKQSSGDEAGCAPKKGVITSVNRGKVYFNAWSMDVKVEGENVVRHFDLTTHNHASSPPGTPPMVHIDEISISFPEVCRDMVDKCNDACSAPGGMSTTGSGTNRKVQSCSDSCRKTQKCLLVPKKLDSAFCCPEEIPPGGVRSNDTLRTGHHLIEDQLVKGNPNFPWYSTNRGGVPSNVAVPPVSPSRDPSSDPVPADVDDAPTVCTNSFPDPGTSHQGMHHVQGVYLEQFQSGGVRANPSAPSNGFTYGKAKESAILAHGTEFGESRCDSTCIEAQLDAFYGCDNERPMNLPSRAQGLGNNRESLHDAWGNVNNERPLTASLGDILKAAGY